MAWKKNSAERIGLLDEAMRSFPCLRKVMFGGPAYFVNDNMFAGLCQDSVILRLSPQDREKLLSAHDGATVFEPMPGRPMKEYVVLPESLYSDSTTMLEWLDRSFHYASSLPPKVSTGKKKS